MGAAGLRGAGCVLGVLPQQSILFQYRQRADTPGPRRVSGGDHWPARHRALPLLTPHTHCWPQSNPDARVMTLKGRQYGCRQEQSLEAERNPAIEVIPYPAHRWFTLYLCQESNATIEELMAPLNQSNSGCLQEDQGWWKFEYCFNRFVRQYHAVADGKGNAKVPSLFASFLTLRICVLQVEQVHYLGRYDKDRQLAPSERPKLLNTKTRSFFSQVKITHYSLSFGSAFLNDFLVSEIL